MCTAQQNVLFWQRTRSRLYPLRVDELRKDLLKSHTFETLVRYYPPESRMWVQTSLARVLQNG